MRKNIQGILVGDIEVFRLESDLLRADIAPALGGRILSIVDKATGYEFLWRNKELKLKVNTSGSVYDENFYGGIDEILPNDIPECIDGTEYPDHGELWTSRLSYHIEHNSISVKGVIPLCRLEYEKKITLRPKVPCIYSDYRISNQNGEAKSFLWKLHAAVNIEPGSMLGCPARYAKSADVQWSRHKTEHSFEWPYIEGRRADVIGHPDGTTDFLFLYDLMSGTVSMTNPTAGMEMTYTFDNNVFPYVCYFGSYGGLKGCYTAVLGPCTAMPLSVNDAARLGQCSKLNPGEEIATTVILYAGRSCN